MEICVWTMSFGFTAAFWTIYSWFSLWIYIADCKFHMKLIAPPFLSPLNEWQLRGDSSSPSSGFVSLSRRARLKRLDILIRSTVTLTRNCLHPLEKWMYRRWTDIVWIEYWSNHRFCWMLLQDVVSRCCFKMLLQDVASRCCCQQKSLRGARCFDLIAASRAFKWKCKRARLSRVIGSIPSRSA